MAGAIILDRDGTLIDFWRDHERGIVTPAFHPDHVRLLPGAIEGLGLLRDAGFVFAIATNQPDAAKGRVPKDAIARTNDALVARLADRGITIARVETCLHHPERHDGGDATLCVDCDCRKPKPGMLLRIVAALGVRSDESWMIGDTASDLGAAHAASMRCALLSLPRRCELCVFRDVTLEGRAPALRAGDMFAAAQAILAS
jgi:D-glycero-D-manno-heptose 1,7-bisphosphate phosphatase